ncbi:MAG TPA: FAD-dependent oxidoreductase [Rubrivivax sp.]|nr:FAD-dependent oxidoreductase [Rubrivivax sp.]
MNRRDVLGLAGLPLAGCSRRDEPIAAVWVGSDPARGHRLRRGDPLPAAVLQRRAQVLVVGGGIAGLAAARGFLRAGIHDVHVLEMEDNPGGNSRGHTLGGLACPLGAHYLPLPMPQSHEVAEWLHEIGLLKTELGRTVADERHLCHSPQERVFIDGTWAEGLLPPTQPGTAFAEQATRFAQEVARVQGKGGAKDFALPAHRSTWSAVHETLNSIPFAEWLAQHRLDDPQLRWYLDYCCRDDYGAAAATVSAWAGLHYFASRHGFSAPGQAEVERDAVFTWPEGNAWLVRQLAKPLNDRVLTARSVLRVVEHRHGVEVLAWNQAEQHVEAWTAQRVVMAVPLFIAARVLDSPPVALVQAAGLLRYAPWLVANLQLREPLLDRPGAPPSWDNVIFGSRGLGYVDAMHQSLRSHVGPTVITAYHALESDGDRTAMLATDPAPWADRVLTDLALAHPDIRRRVQRIELARFGHAMAVPRPGVHRHPALTALRAQRGRIRFAHADLAGYSVFEEAFTAGSEAASG